MLKPNELAALLRRYDLPPRRPRWPLLVRGWAEEAIRAVIFAIIGLVLLRLLGLF